MSQKHLNKEYLDKLVEIVHSWGAQRKLARFVCMKSSGYQKTRYKEKRAIADNHPLLKGKLFKYKKISNDIPLLTGISLFNRPKKC